MGDPLYNINFLLDITQSKNQIPVHTSESIIQMQRFHIMQESTRIVNMYLFGRTLLDELLLFLKLHVNVL